MLSVSLLTTILVGTTSTSCSASLSRPILQSVLDDHATEQRPPVTALAAACEGYSFPHVICINRYGSVIHGDFKREVLMAYKDTYPATSMTQDPTFHNVAKASFLVFDQSRGAKILGSTPVVDFMFHLPNVTHEAPVYVPDTNELYFSRLAHHFLPQLVVNLSAIPPTLSERLADPPIYAPAGARYRNGSIIYATIGGHESLEGHSFRPGLYALDVASGKSRVLLNNYYGYYFNSVDDLDIDAQGQIWFTDNDYGRPDRVNTQPPQINVGTYRFDPHTGQVALVEDTLSQPNGVAFSPDQRTLYLTDTGAGEVIISPHISPPAPRWNSTKPRTVYAYDVSPSRKHLLNKRTIHHAMEFVPDGIKVSRDGYVLTATGYGIDVLTADGTPVVRVLTNFTVVNIAWVERGDGGTIGELWAVGKLGVARIRWGLRGPVVY